MTTYDKLIKNWKDNTGEWLEISEELYDEWLEVLMPLAMNSIGYLNPEPYTHLGTGEGIYTACILWNEKFWAKFMTKKEFDNLKNMPK